MKRVALIVSVMMGLAGLWLGGTLSAQTAREMPANEPHKPAPVVLNRIPSFIQAGRSYAFLPVQGEPFAGKVVSIDSTGWIQIQRHGGTNVGPVAEWYNLDGIVTIKAQ